jgi:hypothetical protein
MSFFNKENKKSLKQEQEDINLEDLAYLLFRIAEKVGVEEIKEEEPEGEKSEGDKSEVDEEDRLEETKGSSILNFLLSKGLTAEEIQEVEDYYKKEEVDDARAEKNQSETKDKPEDKVKPEGKKEESKKEDLKENSSDFKTNSIEKIQRREIERGAGRKNGVLTEAERVKLANAKYSLSNE